MWGLCLITSRDLAVSVKDSCPSMIPSGGRNSSHTTPMRQARIAISDAEAAAKGRAMSGGIKSHDLCLLRTAGQLKFGGGARLFGSAGSNCLNIAALFSCKAIRRGIQHASSPFGSFIVLSSFGTYVSVRDCSSPVIATILECLGS